MWTKESRSYIQNLKPKSNLKSPQLKKLFTILQNNQYEYEEPSIQIKKENFPVHSDYISEHLQNKLKEYKFVNQLNWSVHSEHTIDCTLKLYTHKNKKMNSKIEIKEIFNIAFQNHTQKKFENAKNKVQLLNENFVYQSIIN